MSPDEHDYHAREARARIEIDKQLLAAGWAVQDQDALNLGAAQGVAVREFTLEKGHGRVEYLLFLDGQPAGVIEAKAEGVTLTEVEHQSGKYVEGIPEWMRPPNRTGRWSPAVRAVAPVCFGVSPAGCGVGHYRQPHDPATWETQWRRSVRPG